MTDDCQYFRLEHGGQCHHVFSMVNEWHDQTYVERIQRFRGRAHHENPQAKVWGAMCGGLELTFYARVLVSKHKRTLDKVRFGQITSSVVISVPTFCNLRSRYKMNSPAPITSDAPKSACVVGTSPHTM